MSIVAPVGMKRFRGGRASRGVEHLERRLLMAATPVITEFMAKNSTTLADGNGNYSDWIEIQNQETASVDLVGWHLSDDPSDPDKWTFPDKTVAAGGFLVVFADGAGVPDAAGDLHTNFSLAAAGESVLLSNPAGVVTSQFLNYPAQQSDVSYGTANVVSTTTLIGPTAAATAYVPKDASTDDNAWTDVGYNDSTWTAGNLGVGYDTGEIQDADALPVPTADWVADDLTARIANGGAVAAWAAEGQTAATAAAGSVDPTLVTGQLDGHAVVQFNGSTADTLRVPASANPLSGANDFTVAVVFRTSTPGAGFENNWYYNTGLVDATEAGGPNATNDWGLGLDSGGEAAAGLGNPDTTAYSSGNLDNGAAHVIVYTRSGGNTSVYVDGQQTPYTDDGQGGDGPLDVADLVFGGLQTGGNPFTGDLAEVQAYTSALPTPDADKLANALDLKYGVALPPSPYLPLVNLNLQSAMYGQATTADVRVPFTVAGNPSAYSQLTLDIQYSDGFVAYLNGTQVAAVNAAAAPTTYTSTATAVRPQAAAVTPQAIDLSNYLSLLNGNGGQNVLAIRALSSSLTDPDLLVAPQLSASTFVATGPAYFAVPTPGAANTTPGYVGFATPPTISAPHGYYSSAFQTTLSDLLPGATIYYTTDGSDPSPTNGTAIAPPSATADATGAVTVSTTTPLRAAAYLNTYIPSAIATTTYVFVASVLTQPDTAPSGAYWTSAVDPAVVADTQSPYSVAQALTAIPSMSIVLPFDQIFGSAGIYPNSSEDLETAASFEYFDPNNPTAGFQVNAGLSIQGAGEREQDTNEPKKSFRVHFSSEYGPGSLNYPLFGTADPEQSFDQVILKAVHNFSWANQGGTPIDQADFVRDTYARQLQLLMTGHASRGKWVQLYIDGQYWGLYDAVEEPDSTWAAANFGGSPSDYDVVKPAGDSGALETEDGSMTSYLALFATADADAAAGPITAAEYANLQTLVDVKGLVDYMLNVEDRGDQDAPVNYKDLPHNFYAFNDAKTNGPYEFTTWDGEYGLNYTTINPIQADDSYLNPAHLFQILRTNPDFDQLVADESYKFLYNNNVLEDDGTTDNPEALYDADAAQINVAVVAESARWGDAQQQPAATWADWTNEIDSLNTQYFPVRGPIVLGQLQSAFPMLGVLPPSFAVNGTADRGGVVTAGSVVTLSDQNAVTAGDAIYYTLDGSDPRLSGGGLSPTARLYTGSAIPVTTTQTVTVRTLNGTTWSPVDSATYSVSVPAAAGNLAVTELDYHPSDPTPAELAVNPAWTDSDFEYVEVTNTSADLVNLTGVDFDKGIKVTFAPVTLAPGARGVVVSNAAAFAARYGTGITVLGTYSDHLSNSGETVELKAANGAVIQNFAYSNLWYPRTDGQGSSLEVLSTTGNYNASSNYQPSYTYGGTPGSANVAATTDVVVNEIVAAPAAGQQDAIELYNTTAAVVDVSGWYVSDSGDTYAKYQIPAGTTVAAGGYLVVTAAQFDSAASPTAFALNGTSGDSVYLVKPTAAGGHAFADSVTFGSQVIGESLGRTPNGTGGFYPMSAVTLGATNAPPRVGPVDVTELGTTPVGGNAKLQYVEIQNQTSSTVNVTGWQFSSGVTFTFAAGTTLAPYEPIVIVDFNPVTDPTDAAVFRAAYGLAASARLLGPFVGSLSSAGADVRLVRPDVARSGIVPYVLVDDVTYGVGGAWPTPTAGQSLTRLSNLVYGESPANFAAAAPSPDAVSYGNAYFAGAGFTYSASASLTSLTIVGPATVTLAAGSAGYLDVSALTLSGGGVLNLGDGALVLDGGTAPAAATLAAVTADFLAGTLAGAADATHSTTLGMIVNAAAGMPLYGSATSLGTFDGLSPSSSAVLVRDTYYGDANLDGRVDGADYALIDAGYATATTGWFNGDFNYDSKIDGSDYTLIDNAFNTQAVTPLTSVVAVAAPAADVASGTAGHLGRPVGSQRSKRSSAIPISQPATASPSPFTDAAPDDLYKRLKDAGVLR